MALPGSVDLRGSTKSTSHLRTRHSSSAKPTFPTCSAVGGTSALRLSSLLPSHQLSWLCCEHLQVTPRETKAPCCHETLPPSTSAIFRTYRTAPHHNAKQPAVRCPSLSQLSACPTKENRFLPILSDPSQHRDIISQRPLPEPKRRNNELDRTSTKALVRFYHCDSLRPRISDDLSIEACIPVARTKPEANLRCGWPP